MNWNATINDDVLVKYLLDEASTAERQEVERWILADPSHQKYLDDFRSIIEKSQMADVDDEKDYAALDRLHARMRKEQAIPTRSLFTRTRAIAAVLFIAVASWLTYTLVNQNNKQIHLQSQASIITQTLPDGSLVTLNKQSSLSYPAKFNGKTRPIKLDGEAFFDVQPNKDQPFIIEANGVTVQVVGTSFNVKSRKEHTQVIVETGIVKVSKADKSIELRPGEKVNIVDDAALIKEMNKGKLYNYYYTNELVCDETPLSELVPVLNEKFNANITIVNPKLKDLAISTTFKNNSLQEILKVIGDTFNVEVEHKGTQILLK